MDWFGAHTRVRTGEGLERGETMKQKSVLSSLLFFPGNPTKDVLNDRSVCVCVFFYFCYLGLCEFWDWLEFGHARHHLKMIPIYCMMAKRYVFETWFFEVAVSKMLCWLLLPLSLGKWLNLTSILMFKLWSNGLPTDCLSHTYGNGTFRSSIVRGFFCCCYSCFSDISLLTPTSTRTRCIAILSYSLDFFNCTNGTITVSI